MSELPLPVFRFFTTWLPGYPPAAVCAVTEARKQLIEYNWLVLLIPNDPKYAAMGAASGYTETNEDV